MKHKCLSCNVNNSEISVLLLKKSFYSCLSIKLSISILHFSWGGIIFFVLPIQFYFLTLVYYNSFNVKLFSAIYITWLLPPLPIWDLNYIVISALLVFFTLWLSISIYTFDDQTQCSTNMQSSQVHFNYVYQTTFKWLLYQNPCS